MTTRTLRSVVCVLLLSVTAAQSAPRSARKHQSHPAKVAKSKHAGKHAKTARVEPPPPAEEPEAAPEPKPTKRAIAPGPAVAQSGDDETPPAPPRRR